MGIARIAASLLWAGVLAGFCVPAVAYDAARCDQTRRLIGQIETNLRGNPTASDRQAFEQSLAVYRRAEVGFCGGGPGGGAGGGATGTPFSNAAAQAAGNLGAAASLLGAVNDALARHDAAPPVRAPDTLPAPPVPTGSVSGPMTMQRLGGAGRPLIVAPQVMPPTLAVSPPTVSIAPPSVIAPTPPEISPPALPPAPRVNVRPPEVAEPAVAAGQPSLASLSLSDAMASPTLPTAPTITPPSVLAPMPPTVLVPTPPGGLPHPPEGLPRLPEGLPNSDATGSGSPRTDCAAPTCGPPAAQREADAEQRAILQWQAEAEARLAAALRSGAQVVPENRAARAACRGRWMYDGLSAGACTPGPRLLVYAVRLPAS